jgi:hypothetical protein
VLHQNTENGRKHFKEVIKLSMVISQSVHTPEFNYSPMQLPQVSARLEQARINDGGTTTSTESCGCSAQAAFCICDLSIHPSGDNSLSPEEQKEVEALKKRDAEVRQHELAHLSAAGPYATSGPVYEYETGPDGQRYAVGGEVGIDTTPLAGDPEATIRKAQTIKRAALAPSEPSSQDQRVAAQANKMEQQARQELLTKTPYGSTGFDQDGSKPKPEQTFPKVDFHI